MQTWASQKQSKPTHASRGFTIVELLIVIIVIGILASLILVAYSNVTSQAKVSVLSGDLKQAAKQLDIDKEKTGGGSAYPATLALANNGGGLTPSSGATYNYYAYGASFCLDETKDSLTYFITSAGGVTVPTVGNCISTNGLVGWWPFNGNASDASGAGNTGTVSGPVLTTGENNVTNGAYAFNGSTDYIEFPTQIPSSTGSFTVSMWLKGVATAGDGYAYGIIRSNVNTIGGSVYWLGIRDTGKYSTAVNGNFTQGSTTVTASGSTWVHLAITYDGSKQTTYINGAQAATYTFGAITNTASGTRTLVGSYAGYRALQGSVDDIRIYNRALSATEMQNIYTAGAL